ncbi:hypothetical protein CONPUDRAFT_77257 [Coniophora puteana RWD-64-598 SS2]|uniref:Uncharacterized protein n=1 Tax=Coniophora puteana (strain RWD-64-598) TaxID=741705 RepID=A0A5M3M8S8_CONPW|nr:uncharacterized protein CONPUDRAFT_77257 [Coniophora puteana RWD-64-598 SS2]EIW75609.1 hypothetical protein CONPUDRAFT_77257 [Coniophora puteana RWD-64-598 SS2]
MTLFASNAYLQNVTSDREIWKNAYRDSSLPRPPGPFPWKTTTDLRSALVRSFRVERNWPPTSASAVSQHQLPPMLKTKGQGSVETVKRLLLGRWALAYDDKYLSCFDLDAPDLDRSKWKNLHKMGRDQEINEVMCADYVSADGPRAFVCITFVDMDCISTFGLVFEFMITGPKPKLSLVCELENIPNDNGLKFFVGHKLAVVGFTDNADYEDFPGLRYSEPDEIDELPAFLHPYHGLWVICTDTKKVYTLAPSEPTEPGQNSYNVRGLTTLLVAPELLTLPFPSSSKVFIGPTHLFLARGAHDGRPEIVEAFAAPSHTLGPGEQFVTSSSIDVTPPHYPYVELHATHKTMLPEGVYIATTYLNPPGKPINPVLAVDPWIGENTVVVSACDLRGQPDNISPELLVMRLTLGSVDEAPKGQLAPINVEVAHVAGAVRPFASEMSSPTQSSNLIFPHSMKVQSLDVGEVRVLVQGRGGEPGQNDSKMRLSGMTLGVSGDAFPNLTRSCIDSDPLVIEAGSYGVSCFDGPSGRALVVREKGKIVLVDFA